MDPPYLGDGPLGVQKGDHTEQGPTSLRNGHFQVGLAPLELRWLPETSIQTSEDCSAQLVLVPPEHSGGCLQKTELRPRPLKMEPGLVDNGISERA